MCKIIIHKLRIVLTVASSRTSSHGLEVADCSASTLMVIMSWVCMH